MNGLGQRQIKDTFVSLEIEDILNAENDCTQQKDGDDIWMSIK